MVQTLVDKQRGCLLSHQTDTYKSISREGRERPHDVGGDSPEGCRVAHEEEYTTTMPPKYKFTENEKVLCYHGPLLYEAKVCFSLCVACSGLKQLYCTVAIVGAH